jgi:RNA polymerase sigma-70 factor (ECF subfamily)
LTDLNPDIERLKRLDDAEWLAVQHAYCGRLFAFARRRLRDVQACEDVLQETWLGAVRGIVDFDTRYTFEQYVFGICRNRTIDALRRRRPRTLDRGSEGDELPGIEMLATDSDTPSRILRREELGARARDLLVAVLKEWVEETWRAGEFQRLMVFEALIGGGWRNRDAWRHFGLHDETAVAGIKFRALKRLRELAAVRESGGDLLSALGQNAEGEEHALDFDMRPVWRDGRVSCPSRHWIARMIAGNLEKKPTEFVRFHIEQMHCPWCAANHDDLVDADRASALDPLIERVRASTVQYLRSRTLP